ncbi:hypothetical protein Tco_1495449 [Tanacetum coccineum]
MHQGPEVSATRMSRLFGTYYRQGDMRQVQEEATARCTDRQNFSPEVFPEDLPGLPHTRQVEFHIDLVPEQARARRASEDNIGVVEERGVCRIDIP